MEENQISSDPDAVVEQESDPLLTDFERAIVLMSLDSELRALVREMNAGPGDDSVLGFVDRGGEVRHPR